MSTDVIDGAVRVSKLGGRIVSADSTITLDDQHRKLHEAAAVVGKRIGRVFELLDESGFTSAGGEVMGEMLARVERGESAGVAFAYQSRNGRNWWEQGPFFSRLQDADGLYVIRGLESIDYRTPVGRQVFGMQAVQDEGVYWAAKQNGDNTAEAMMARKVSNRVPYGYARNGTFIDGQLAYKIDDARDSKALVKAETAGVIERIFQMADTGFGTSVLARVLNDDGVPGPRGGRWATTTVASILENPIYKGELTYGRRNPKRKPGAKANVRTAQDPALAIVTPELWRRVQKRGKPMQRTGTYKAGVAGGVLTCSACKRALQIVGSGDGRRSYGCPRDSTAAPCPRPVYVRKDVADKYVSDLVSSHLAVEVLGEGVDGGATLKEAHAAWMAARANRDALLDKLSPSHPKFTEWLERYDAEVADAQAAYDALAAERDARATLPADAAAFGNLSEIERNQVARLLLRVEVAPPVSRSKFAPILERFTPDWR